MNVVIIAMWSGPRNISTAMMRSFENREDTFVSDEPFYAHYLKLTGIDHPMRKEVMETRNSDWDEVSQYLTGTIPQDKSVWHQKHMAQHNLPGIELDWTSRLTNCFLIRNPGEVILSYSKKYEITSVYQLGFPQQFELYDKIEQDSGMSPIVIDSKDVLMNPKNMLQKLCEKLEVPFSDKMLSWSPGKRDSDGVWGQHWYGNVEKSTGFQAYQKKEEEMPKEYTEIYEECMKYYQQLFEQRIH
ncbi:MAG TPA: HAD family hydrolase [Candidatus Marinimicrobia bacterium]|nr:HAD family hydrolase [Candidatus Neomarinimicrobiota bacterium]